MRFSRLGPVFRTFWNDRRASVSVESIFTALFLSFMIAPTMYVMRVAETHLDGSWLQRTAARHHAHFFLCGDSIVATPFAIWRDGVNSANYVVCTEADLDEPPSNRFWKKIENAVSSDFPTLVDDMKNEGDIKMHRSTRVTTFSRDLDVGTLTGAQRASLIENDGGLLDPLLGLIPDTPTAMAPSPDYYRFYESHWQRGHDRVIWAKFSEEARQMFPNVFPSR